MKYYLLIWVSNQLYFVDTYSTMDECLQQGHLLLQNQNQYKVSNTNEVESPTQIVSPFKDKILISGFSIVKVIDVSGHAFGTPRL